MVKVNRLAKIISLAILLTACSDDWEQVAAPQENSVAKFYEQTGAKFDSCFLENVEEYSAKVKQEFDKSCSPRFGWEKKQLVVLVVPELPSQGKYTDYGAIYIHKDFRQIAIYGHEYVRYLCQLSGCCQWDHTSLDWSGFIGEMWNFAETLAVKTCP